VNSLADRHGEGCWKAFTIGTGRFARSLCLLVACSAPSAAATAQRAEAPPAKGFILHEQRQVDRFVVQQWASDGAPDVSATGFCDCITVVYEGSRRILRLGPDAGITRVESSGQDITGDGRAELVVTTNSGGAHCCDSTTIYSVDTAPKVILSLATGNCPGELLDLDNDGVPEFRTCDDTFANALCSFADSPMPTVVLAYDKTKGEYVVATPRYLNAVQETEASVAEALKAIDENPRDAGMLRCSALAPALSLVYAGRVKEGVALFRRLYTRPDAAQIEQKFMKLVRSSPLWTAR
jgi:hypothetical protein